MNNHKLGTMTISEKDYLWSYTYETFSNHSFSHFLYFRPVLNPQLEIYVQFSQKKSYEGTPCLYHGQPEEMNLCRPHFARQVLEYVFQNWCSETDMCRLDIHNSECILKELGYSDFYEEDAPISIQDYYEGIRKICAVMEDFGDSCQFAPPASEQELQEWEQEIGCPLPDLYRQWLALTKYANMTNGGSELFAPQALDGCDYVCVGSVIGDGDDYYFNRKTGRFFRQFESEITLFDSFIDLLDDLYCWLETCANGEYGDEWIEVYDRMFPEDAE